MKKHFINIFKPNTDLVFAIKKEVRMNGTEKLTPVVKKKGFWGEWIPIIKVNNSFEASHFHSDFEYTERDCIEYINGYREKLERVNGTQLIETTYLQVF